MTTHTATDPDGEDLTPDPALVRRVAERVRVFLGDPEYIGKVRFAAIEDAITTDLDLAADLAHLDDGARELLLDDVQTELG